MSKTGLGKHAVKGVIVVTLSNNIIFGLSFLANNIILARLLPVEAFGVFALATFFVSSVARIKELGFDYAVVHSQEDIKKIANVYLSLQIILSLTISLISIPASLFVTIFYGNEVGIATMLIGVFSIFTNLFNSLNSLYDKELKFQTSTTITVISTAVSLLGMIIMGFAGFGLWSLVLGGIPGTLLGLILMFILLPTKFEWDLDKKLVRWFLEFGPWWYWALAATASLVIFQYDNFIVYTLTSAFVVGAYTKAYSWATLPTSRVTAIISKVAFPVYAKLQDQKEKLSQAYFLTLSTIVALTFPLSFLSILIIREATTLLIGEKWLSMVPMFQLLLGYMLLRPIFDDSGALLVAIGKSREFNSVQLLQAVLMVVFTTLLVYLFGGLGAPIGVAIVMLSGVIYQYFNLRDYVKIPIKQVFLAPLVASGLALIIGYLTKKVLLKGYPDIGVIIILGITFVIVYAGIMFLVKGKEIKAQVSEFKEIINS